MFEFNHYALGGVRATNKHTCACTLHFDYGVEQACSAAARVTSSHALSRAFPSFAFSRSALFLPYEAFPHAEGRRLRIRSPLSSSLRVQFLFRSGRTCFPTAVAGVFQNRIAYFFALARLFRGVFVFLGGRMCFPGRDCVRVHNLLWEGVLGGMFLSRGSLDV